MGRSAPSSRDSITTGARPCVRLPLGVDPAVPGHAAQRHLVAFGVDHALVPPHPRQRGGVTGREEQVHGRPGRRLRIRVVRTQELLAGDRGACPVRHHVAVAGELVRRVADRLEATPAGAHHRRLRVDDARLGALDVKAGDADDAVVLPQQLGHDEAVDDLHAGAHDLLADRRREARQPVDHLTHQRRELVLVGQRDLRQRMGEAHRLAVLLEEPHAPRTQVPEALVGLAEDDLVPAPVVEVLADDADLGEPGVEVVSPRFVEDDRVAGVGGLAGLAHEALVHEHDVAALLAGLDGREAAGHAAADHQHVGRDRAVLERTHGVVILPGTPCARRRCTTPPRHCRRASPRRLPARRRGRRARAPSWRSARPGGR